MRESSGLIPPFKIEGPLEPKLFSRQFCRSGEGREADLKQNC